MADTFTSTTQLSNQVQTAFDRVARMALRENLVFDRLAREKPVQQAMPGDTVTFTLWSDLATATGALTETSDVDAVGLSDSQVSVTLAEQGNAILVTRKLKALGFLVNFDADAANIIARNMAASIDELCRTEFDNATNSIFSGDATSTGTLEAADELSVSDLREAHAALRADSVSAWLPAAGLYVAVIHPDVAFDLKEETGDGAWVAPHQYVDTNAIYINEIGSLAGSRVVENALATVTTDGGSGTVDAYNSYVVGREAMAKAVAVEPHVVVGPVTDKLQRHFPLGWYALLGYKILREEAIRLIESASSIGAN